MAKIRYHGFSSKQYLRRKQSMTLTEVALVKQDLMNHIFTRRGERRMNPNFGTDIPDMVFEQIDDDAIRVIRSEMERVFALDPRVAVVDMAVHALPDMNTIVASAVLQYLELDAVDRLDLQIEFNTQ